MIDVFVSDRGNAFMREIAEHLAEGLQLAGRPARVVVGALPSPDRPPLEQLAVAPHELYLLSDATASDKARAARSSVAVNTEQPTSSFFRTSMEHARRGPLVLDINALSVAAVRRLGVPAFHLPLGYVPSMDRWHGDAAAPRDVDIAFMGGRTERRERFLAGAASQLWEWRTELRVFSWHRPVTGTADGRAPADFLLGDRKADALAATRIMLNVHRDEEPYFEWARVIEAIANGCVVATETSTGLHPLVAGQHLLVAPLESLAEEAVALALDEPRRRHMADAAYRLVTNELQQHRIVADVLDRAARSLRGPGAVAARRRSTAVGSPATAQLARRAARIARRGLRRIGGARDAPPAIDVTTEPARVLARELKDAFLVQLGATRSLERSLALVRHGSANHRDRVETPAWATCAPRVSVVIPLHRQGRYLEESVASVVSASSGSAAATEIVIVDDASPDDAAEVAEQLLATHPWFPIRLVRTAANGGLPVARNVGIAESRAPFVFPLDADNVLYPNGLRTLVDRLDGSPPEVAAAYGILERFDQDGSVGLTSHLPWEVDLLVQGAYIDAMALIRRSALDDVGGYADVAAIHGWEDYDLWLAVAERGWRADLVPRFTGRYREHAASMRHVSDIDMASTFITLRERHPRLPWPS